jgi:undecaprenyl-diphosphatase
MAANLPTPSDVPAIAAFDEAVDVWMRDHRSPAADAVFYGLSSAADHSLLWNAIVAVRGAITGDPASVLRGAAVLGTESAITNGALKALFRRERPVVDDEPLPMGMRRPVTSSFPSGHATAAFTAAALLAQGSKRPGLWYALAATVAASRVYTRMHHASDVLAGAALGVAFGAIARRVLPLRGR